MSTDTAMETSAFSGALRRLYLVRVGFALIWAGLLLLAAEPAGLFLTVLLVVYPLFDAGAVWWQLRAERGERRSRISAWVNVAVSVVVAAALGVASTVSVAAVLTVWGVWAIGSGVPQFVTAVRNRRSGGQVAQMFSGGLSVLAGGAFLAQGLQGAEDVAMVGGYAAVGGVFFLISAIRLSGTPRKNPA